MYIQRIIEDLDTNNKNNSYGYDHMLYLRLFEGCNLFCEHCFIPSNPKKINKSFYENMGVTKELIKYGNIKEGDCIYIQWHGGEPTLLGVDYLKDALLEIEKDTSFKYIHGIQTNLMNFHHNTKEWVDFYKTHMGSNLGVSWDYGIRHIKSSSLSETDTNKEFNKQFWENVKLAIEAGLELYMVVTATKLLFEHFKNPFNFFDMMQEYKITKLNFERITKTGYARQSWEKIGLTNAEYSKYMSKFFKAYVLYKENNPNVNLNISPFDGLLNSVVSLEVNKNKVNENIPNVWDILSYKNQGYGCWSGECDTKFHTIDSNGYKHGCTALTSEQDNNNKQLNETLRLKKVVWFGKKEVIASKKTQRDIIVEQRKIRQDTCVGCDFITICSSGCLSVEKLDESGECSGAKILFKTIQEQIKPYINIQHKNEIL
jgi:radical SAM protein with 4Fe4S-binding SPASM domain